jgi:hypothetical protein
MSDDLVTIESPPKDARYAQTEFVVEATSNEMHLFWQLYSHESQHSEAFERSLRANPGSVRVIWSQDSMGLHETIGYIDENEDRPVCISICWNFLNGHRVLFWEATSRFVDHEMIEMWFRKYCNPQQDGRPAHCNSSNFHHALHYVRGR